MGFLINGEKFYATTKRFMPAGVVKNFPIYNLIVETYLFPFDRSVVFDQGLKSMANKVTAKMRGICSYLLFLFSIGAVTLAQLLSDNLDIMIEVAYIMSLWDNIVQFVQVSRRCHP